MTSHRIGTREEWLAARLDLLKAEKELTRRGDELARRRQQLPWVPVDKDYRFDSEEGELSLRGLFRDHSQLLVYHFMFGPDWTEGCPSCSSVADGFDGIRVHLEHHDVALAAVSRAPIEKLTAYKQRMGWSFPWASSFRSDFNFDFGVSFTEESVAPGAEYNFRRLEGAQLDPHMLPYEGHGLSVFALDGGVVHHTYSAYARGTDVLWRWVARLHHVSLRGAARWREACERGVHLSRMGILKVIGPAGSAIVASAPSAGRAGGRAVHNTLATIRSKTGLEV